eukprot:CAMPEP_0173419226 /NCGR_PEP_ID=MMETSP1357-20121228/1153_1 /TAXON_ID=77926 /ORGANISM="Hemiselmis rufescens, Strain PCC563" /LENGTH=133 /DNA_ID=CAMNT_0014381839 /DNA_START=99 /DNA_END=497 /DNA_ORIENTATION=-
MPPAQTQHASIPELDELSMSDMRTEPHLASHSFDAHDAWFIGSVSKHAGHAGTPPPPEPGGEEGRGARGAEARLAAVPQGLGRRWGVRRRAAQLAAQKTHDARGGQAQEGRAPGAAAGGGGAARPGRGVRGGG